MAQARQHDHQAQLVNPQRQQVQHPTFLRCFFYVLLSLISCDLQTLTTFRRFAKTSIGKKNWKACEKLHKIHWSFAISRKFYEELCSSEVRRQRRLSFFFYS
jgi:hypothetical protein